MNVLHTHYKVATLTGQVLFVANGEKVLEQVLGLRLEGVQRIKAEINVHGPDHRVELCGNGRPFLGAHEFVLVSITKRIREG